MKHVSTLMAGVFSNILSPLYTDVNGKVMLIHTERFEIGILFSGDGCQTISALTDFDISCRFPYAFLTT